MAISQKPKTGGAEGGSRFGTTQGFGGDCIFSKEMCIQVCKVEF